MTAEQIQSIAAHVFVPENRVVLMYVPATAEAETDATARQAAETTTETAA